jgi:YesN/AraC family two-component response regulator
MKHTVLYIDDEAANLRGFKSVFRRDYNVLTALSGMEGLEILDNEKCHLIITDQRMPEMTGVQFLKKVHDKIPSVPPNRIILSGFSQDEDIKEAEDNYFLYMFISKPWNADELRIIMNDAITNAFDDKIEL